MQLQKPQIPVACLSCATEYCIISSSFVHSLRAAFLHHSCGVVSVQPYSLAVGSDAHIQYNHIEQDSGGLQM